MIKKILRNHTMPLLAALAIIFLVIVIASYAWGIGYLVFEVNEANNHAATAAQASEFNLDAAAKLDYRGTLQNP